MKRAALPVLAILAAAAAQLGPASQRVLGHTPDQSFCRVTQVKSELIVSFAFDFGMLNEFGVLDANADGKVDLAEVEALAPALESVLRRTVELRVDGREVPLGAAEPLASGEKKPVPQSDLHVRLAVIRFRQPAPKPGSRLSIRVGYVSELRTEHVVLGSLPGSPLEKRVVFSEENPEHTFILHPREP